MKIIFTNIQKSKAISKANRDAEIAFGLGGRTSHVVYKSKKVYDRKRDKKIIF
jgi:hypothetical protein